MAFGRPSRFARTAFVVLLQTPFRSALSDRRAAGPGCSGNIAKRDHSTLGLERHYNLVFTKSRQQFMQTKLDKSVFRVHRISGT